MKKSFLLVLFLIINITSVFACGWTGFDRMEPGFILVPLGDMLPGYSDRWRPQAWDDHDMVISEWRQRLGIKDKDSAEWLKIVLYGTDWTYDKKVREADNVKRISMAKASLKKFPKDLEYLLPVIERDIKLSNPWEEKPEITEEQFRAFKTKALSSGTDRFLKRRYGYQAIKFANRLGHHDEAVTMFNGVFAAGNERDSVYFRSWSIYCSSLAETGDKKKALAECMDMYADYPSQRFGIEEFLIKKTGEAERKEYIDSAEPVKKRATLAWLAGDIEKTLALEPFTDRSRNMFYNRIVALDRECIPALWDRFASGKPAAKGAADYREEIVLLEKVAALQLERDKTARAQVFYHTMYGYLMLLKNNPDGADAQFDMAITSAGQKSVQAGQARVLKLVSYFGRTTGCDADFQKRIAGDLDLFDIDTNVFYSLLADRFMHNKDLVRAALCIGKTGEYAAYMDFIIDYMLNLRELDELKELAGGKFSRPADKYILAGLTYTADDITYAKAMRFMKELDYAQAYNLLDSIKTPGYWPNPGKFEEHQDSDSSVWLTKGALIHPDHADPAKEVRVNKKELAKMLMELTAPAADAEKAAANLIQAAAIYRGCYYPAYTDVIWEGNRVWTLRTYLHDYFWSFKGVFEPIDSEKIDSMIFDASHGNLITAADYYNRAAQITKNSELAAECLGYAASLRAACSQSAEKELAALRGKYASTEFYKAYSNICTRIKYNYKGN
ncbi:MAG: hypothetical protein LLG37_05275 [Spirochaetia bacterium]|nr:hypothetical protein [Spirochaetia bacterium]